MEIMPANGGYTASVLILTWNHERFIAQAIDSVLSQTAGDIEILLLDNGSSDRTLSIATELLTGADRPHRIVRPDKPQGIAANFNLLFRLSSGRYIFPLSGDDWYHPDMVADKVAFMDANPEVGLLSSGGWIYYDDTGRTEEMDRSWYRRGNIYREVMTQVGSFNFVGCCYRRSVLEEVGLWDEALAIEDLDMFVRIARTYRIDFLEKSLVYYRKNEHAISNNTDFIIRGWEQFYEKYKAVDWIDMNKWLGERYRMYAATQIDAGRRPEALKLIKKSFGKYPLNAALFRTVWYYLRSK